MIATSALARVEVGRAVKVATGGGEALEAAEDLIDGCVLVDVDDTVIRAALRLASPHLRTLDAIHLASALAVEPQQMLVYDRRLAEAATAAGLAVTSPGAESS